MVVGDVTTGTEVLVIGAGPGGYVAAIRAAQRDLDVTLVERDAYGGVCLNRGCIPSKAYITATDVAHDAATAEEMGVHADPVVDLAGMREWKDGVVDRLTGGVEKLCKANGVNLIEGTAKFVDAGTVRVEHGGDGQGAETVSFEHCIVSTGSRPIQLPGFDFAADDPVLDSAGLLATETVPDRLVVVGAGYIGMELSTVFAKLGSDVTVVEMLDDVLPGYEDDVSRIVRKRAEDLGVDFEFGEGATGWHHGADGGIVVTAETEAGEESAYGADRVLVAVGREPVTDSLDAGKAGLEPDADGFFETDERCETDVDGIYAVGDVAGEPMLAHTASAEGVVAAEAIAGEPVAFDAQAIPAAVFTEPEIATVGLTADEAETEGYDPVTGEMPFNASGRALTVGETDGFVRVVASADGFLLGAQIVGPEASELIAEPTLAVEMGARLEDVASTIHTHPTLSEAVMEAVENALGQAIHTLNR
jgi:dihydrolipoamide dehydrogenase